MESIGFKSWIPINEFNTIGLFEVLIRIKKFLKILKKIENQIRLNEPNILITIDSPSLSYRVVKRIQDLKENKNITKYFTVKTPEENSGMYADFKNLISIYCSNQ